MLNNFKKIALPITMAALLSACATPHVVQTVKVTDSQLTCNQIDLEMAEAERFREGADKEKGMTGTNVAAALFFWPAMIGTYSNANQAIAAADSRKSHLTLLHGQKKCAERALAADALPVVADKSDIKLANLKAMLDKGLITKDEYDTKRQQIISQM